MIISALILTKNEEETIENCLKQLDFVDEIIILDQNSTDNTVKISHKYTDDIIKTSETKFDVSRNILAKEAKGDWLLYLDSDERVSEELKSEIKQVVQEGTFSAYFVARKNYVLGKWLKHGGWYPDYVPRLFKRSKLVRWQGAVHESPTIKGRSGKLNNPIEHLTARNFSTMLAKTTSWAKIEAQLSYDANHPNINSPKIIKAFLDEFIRRYFFKFGFLDGTVGLIEAIFQGYHRSALLVYLWEIQNNSIGKFQKIKNV